MRQVNAVNLLSFYGIKAIANVARKRLAGFKLIIYKVSHKYHIEMANKLKL